MADPRFQTPSSYLGKIGAIYPKPAGNVNRSAAIPTTKKKTTLPVRVNPDATVVGVVDPTVNKQTAEEFIREQANRYIAAQVDAINAQKAAYLEDLQRQSDLEMQRGQALSQALQGLNMPGRISDIYGNASANISGLAQGFSGQQKALAEADTAAQQRMLSGSGQEGAVRNQGENLANVTYGTGGYIPARNMQETQAALASQAALEPGYAQRIGQVKAADVYSAGLTNLRDFTDKILEAQGQRPELENTLSEQYYKRQKDIADAEKPDISYRTLSNGQIQAFDDKTGLAQGAPYGPIKAGTKGKVTVRNLANGQLQAIGPDGKAIGKPYGPVRETKPTGYRAVPYGNGQYITYDPITGMTIGQPFGVPKPVTSGQVTLQAKPTADGRLQWYNPKTGQAVGKPFGHSGPAVSKAGMTPAALASAKKSAGTIASQAWNGVKTTQLQPVLDQDGNPVIQADGSPKMRNMSGMTHMSYQEAMREGLARGIPLTVMQQALNGYWTKPGYDYDFSKKKWVKGGGGGRPLKPYQERSPFSPGGGWGGSQSPAAAGAAIAKTFGLHVISEKRDTKMTASGHPSDHWVGSKDSYAYDLSNGSSPTPQMDHAAMALVEALGGHYDGKSELVQNFYQNGYRYQILYRTNVGGNHFNHIHFGVRREEGTPNPVTPENTASGQSPAQSFSAPIAQMYAQRPTDQGLVALLKAAGFKGEGLRTAYGIAKRESGGRAQAYNGNTGTGDQSYGLFQINMMGNMGPSRRLQFGLSSNQDLFDPLRNAQAAYRMSRGGTDFGAWGIGPNAYRSGAGYNTISRYVNQMPGG